jgi:hypothetical protein
MELVLKERAEARAQRLAAGIQPWLIGNPRDASLRMSGADNPHTGGARRLLAAWDRSWSHR